MSALVTASAWGWCAAGLGQPTLVAVSPGAIAPGTTAELVLEGRGLGEPLAIWSSLPGTLELLPPDGADPASSRRRVRVTLPADAAPGVVGLVVATPEGITDPLLFMVDSLPSVADDGENRTPARPQAVTPPVAVDGVGDGSSCDHYSFHGRAGERIAIEVYAARLGQAFDPVVRLLDAAGRELAWADDDAAAGADCRLSCTLPATGTYLVELRDNEFRAGGRYRLRIGDFPAAFTAYPLGVQAGTTGQVAAAGGDAAGIAPRSLVVHADRAGEPLNLAMTRAGGSAAAIATIVAGHGPETLEAEPNGSAGEATAVSVPGGVSGRFDAARERDFYGFTATAGQRLAFRPFTRSVGSPAVVRMKLLDADGKTVAETAVNEADEETLVAAIPADGSYRLVAEDLLGRGGEDMTYRIGIDAAAPFSLSLKPDRKGFASLPVPANPCRAVAGNGALAIDVRLKRSGYDGPVKLTVEGPDGPYRVFNDVIGEKKTAARMIVMPPEGSPAGRIALVRIRGTATVDGRPFTTVAGTADLLRNNRPMLVHPPAAIDGLLPITVVAPLPPLFAATLDKPAVELPAGGGEGEFTVLLERKSEAFDDVLEVTFPDPPTGFTFEVKREGDGPAVLGRRQTKEIYRVIVKAAADTPPGTHRVRVLAYGEVDGRGFAVPCGDVACVIAAPTAEGDAAEKPPAGKEAPEAGGAASSGPGAGRR